MSLMRILRDGPVVSLNGSPTVSPTTEAAWASLPCRRIPPLQCTSSHCPKRPPAFDIIMAKSTPVTVAPASIPEGVFAQYPPDEDRQDDGKGTWNDHLAQGRASTDGDAVCVIGLCLALHQSRNLAKLATHLLDHAEGGPFYRLHRERAEQERQHSADEQSDDDDGLQQVDAGYARGPRIG